MAKKKQELSSEELLAEALVREEDWPYEVPGNWVWTRLGSVADKITDGTHNPPPNSMMGIPLLSAKNIFNYAIDLDSTNRWITQEQWEQENKRTNIKTDDVLLTIVGSIGRTAVVKDAKFALQRSVAVISSKIVMSKYISYYLSSPYMSSFLNENAKGTAQKGFYLAALNAINFPLPPLAEQQRIVDRIESLFDQLDQAKDLIQDALDSFETRKAAILHQAFTGQLTKKWRVAHGMELESWKETKSESIFEYVTSGSRGWAQYYDTNGSIFIRMGNLDHGTIELDLADIQYVKLPENVEGKRSKVEKNDVLISITADVGMVGLVRNENMEAYINQHVALARPVKSVNAEFIAWFLVSDIGLHQLQSLQRGVTKIGLTLGDIKNLTIKLPCLSEQIEIVRIIDFLFAKEQNAKDLIDLIDQIDAMKKTILGKAFRGELGTNEAEEESALNLLKK